MIVSASPPSSEVIPKLEDNEVVIFWDLLFIGLRFELDPVLVDILRPFDIYLHQLTPNTLIRLSTYIWICKTTKIKASAAGFAAAHKVHHQPKYLLEDEGGEVIEKEAQFRCLNFI
uniref:Transposase (putative) gypsy type domain-containing protein n=1 Tax=Setaria italica TaxID=4555 RepID=K3Z0Q9_SETIT